MRHQAAEVWAIENGRTFAPRIADEEQTHCRMFSALTLVSVLSGVNGAGAAGPSRSTEEHPL